jgi:hypothetical protein
VVWQDFHPPAYEQLWGAFVPNLSILDAALNVGPDGLVALVRSPVAQRGGS